MDEWDSEFLTIPPGPPSAFHFCGGRLSECVDGDSFETGDHFPSLCFLAIAGLERMANGLPIGEPIGADVERG